MSVQTVLRQANLKQGCGSGYFVNRFRFHTYRFRFH